MKVAIMQPYFLPYIGYFQLVAAVDKFVVLDDVNYMKGGWINRNFICVNGCKQWLTIPLHEASPNTRIKDVEIAAHSVWARKLIKTVEQNYRKEKYYPVGFAIFEELIGSARGNLSEFLTSALLKLCCLLQISTEIIPSSSVFGCNNLKGQERILKICEMLGSDTYVNLPGGKQLYQGNAFESVGVNLLFIEQCIQSGSINTGMENSPYISILDILMKNPLDAIRVALQEFTLSQAK